MFTVSFNNKIFRTQHFYKIFYIHLLRNIHTNFSDVEALRCWAKAVY